MNEWSKAFAPFDKNKGDLGIKNLRRQNISPLCKWTWKLETQKSLLQDIVNAKYLRTKTITYVKLRMSDSPSWKAILGVRDYYLLVDK
jgi:hypothetical protein